MYLKYLSVTSTSLIGQLPLPTFTKPPLPIRRIFNTVFCAFALLLVAKSSYADTSEDKIIEKISAAYGGSKLTTLKAMTIYDHRKNVFAEQSAPAQTPDLWRFNEELTIDFNNKRKSLLSWRVNSTNSDLEKFLVDDKSGRVYDLLHNKYIVDNWYNFANTGQSFNRTSDTLIAKKILETPNKLTHLDDVQYRGNRHYQVTFPVTGETLSQIYIDQQTGLISKVSRNHPQAGELTYLFANHAKVDNIAFARDMNFFVAEKPRTISTFRNIDLTPNLSKRFTTPKNTTSWGTPLDSNKMQTNEIVDGVYHVGKGFSRTLFIDAGEYFLSTGGDRKLAENFNYLQNHLQTEKPLKYAVLTHHHTSQLGLVKPALALGAKIITVKSNLSAINTKLKQTVNVENLIVIDKATNLLNGQVTIFDIPTAHADHNLVTYLPKEKLLYAEDHYEVLYQSGKPRAFKNMVTFAKKIKDLNIKVNSFVNGSSARILSNAEFEATIKTYTKPSCPPGYSVCKNG